GYILAQSHISKPQQLSVLLTSIFIANVPDLDILIGIALQGDPKIFHRQATHSLIVAVLISILTALMTYSIQFKHWKSLSLWVGGLYISHIVLDLMVADDVSPMGVQAFWPLTSDYAISPLTIFSGFDYGGSGLFSFLVSLITFQNLISVVQEIVILVPCIILIRYGQKYLKKTAYPER
ncbi:MAG: metal-dependent hydrolase, partial [Cyanobacteriota bacterium]|nr:metal-dependent hydrolase [Cyanobacteriota bacterium]